MGVGAAHSLAHPSVGGGGVAMPPSGASYVCDFEAALMKRWHEEGKSIDEIASLVKRDWHTVSRHLVKPDASRRVGRPRIIQEKQ